VAEKTEKPKKKVMLRRRAPQIVKDHRRALAMRRGAQLRAATRYLNVTHGLVLPPTRGDAPEVRELIGSRQPAEPARHGIPRFYLAGLSELNFTVNGQCQRDERIASRWTIRAVHSGELLGVPPSGRGLTLTGVTLNTVEGELVKLEDFTDHLGNRVEEQWAFWVVEDWNYMDLQSFAASVRDGHGGPGA
jgi:hypothetical protein